jgi:amino acid transporter
VGLALAVLVVLVVPIVLILLVAEASPFTGDAIDPSDGNILEPAERATLNGIASAMGWVFLGGTLLGLLALILGALSLRTTSRFGWATIVLACATPVLCCVISLWTLAAAASPDFTDPNSSAATVAHDVTSNTWMSAAQVR